MVFAFHPWLGLDNDASSIDILRRPFLQVQRDTSIQLWTSVQRDMLATVRLSNSSLFIERAHALRAVANSLNNTVSRLFTRGRQSTHISSDRYIDNYCSACRGAGRRV